jgi:hypothetical protein
MESLHRFLDTSFQNYFDVRRFGAHVGLEIKCPACPWLPPKQNANEDFVWYGYRKWRALASHMASEHCSKQALSYRHRAAVLKQEKELGKQNPKVSKPAA